MVEATKSRVLGADRPCRYSKGQQTGIQHRKLTKSNHEYAQLVETVFVFGCLLLLLGQVLVFLAVAAVVCVCILHIVFC